MHSYCRRDWGCWGLKLESAVLLTAYGSSGRRTKKQLYIAFHIGDDCLEHVFLVSSQPIESLLIGADFLQQYRLVVNFKPNCLTYEIEGNVKECKVTNKVEAELEPQDSLCHGLPERAEYDVTQTINFESVWTVRKYVAFVSRNRELCGDMMGGEINFFYINVKEYGKGNTSCMSNVLKQNMNDVIEFNASYNKNQRVAQFLAYFDKERYMFRTQLLSVIRSINTVYTAIGISC